MRFSEEHAGVADKQTYTKPELQSVEIKSTSTGPVSDPTELPMVFQMS